MTGLGGARKEISVAVRRITRIIRPPHLGHVQRWAIGSAANLDGTVTLSASINLNGQPIELAMFGIICNDGNQVRITQIGPTMGDLKVPGLPPNFLGSVITGAWIQQ